MSRRTDRRRPPSGSALRPRPRLSGVGRSRKRRPTCRPAKRTAAVLRSTRSRCERRRHPDPGDRAAGPPRPAAPRMPRCGRHRDGWIRCELGAEGSGMVSRTCGGRCAAGRFQSARSATPKEIAATAASAHTSSERDCRTTAGVAPPPHHCRTHPRAPAASSPHLERAVLDPSRGSAGGM